MNTLTASPLLAAPFRPFFLLTALAGCLLPLLWAGLLLGGWPLPLGHSPLRWHAHEMLFGLVPAAIAGFLLTAMCNWTGAPLLRGGGLLALVALWLAGRVSMLCAGFLPPLAVAAVNLAFLPAVALYAARVLLRHGNRRNHGLPLILLALWGAQWALHLELLGIGHFARRGEGAALLLISVLMIVIGGRITPAFSRNWLKLHGGRPESVRSNVWLDRLAIAGALLPLPALLLAADLRPAAILALAAALANAARLALWNGCSVRREPLLWILHLGYAWIVLGLLLLGLTPFMGWSHSLWLHALGSGAIGTLLIGVMTRVSLGHTGRPLRLPRGVVALYLAVSLGAALRLLVALGMIGERLGLLGASVFWALAFVGFLVLYWPVLSQARPDGRPG